MDPDLVLERIAALGVILLEGREPGFDEPVAGTEDVLGRGDLDAEVIHHGVVTGLAFEQHEFQRRPGDGEVGVPRASLSRFGAEQCGIEGDRALQVGDPQSQLNSRHHHSLVEEQATAYAPLFKALGDPVRLRLFSLIAPPEGGEACVCDLTGTFDLSGPTISHHLKALKQANLVDSERRGTWVYYRVRPEILARIRPH